MKRILIFICIISFSSCKEKPRIFLGFELLSTENEYYKHRKELIEQKKILTNTGNDFYSMECGSGYQFGWNTSPGFLFKPHFTDDQLHELSLTAYFNALTDEIWDTVTHKFVRSYIKDTTAISAEFKCILDTYFGKYGKPHDTLGHEGIKSNLWDNQMYIDTGFAWTMPGYKITLGFTKRMYNMAAERNTDNLYLIVVYTADWQTLSNKDRKIREQRERERPNDI